MQGPKSGRWSGSPRARRRPVFSATLVLLIFLLWCGAALAHAVAEGDKGYIQEITGVHLSPSSISAPSTW